MCEQAEASRFYANPVFLESDLEDYLHKQIPLSKAMGIRVCSASNDEVRLWVPLQPNLNHRQTLFGGSASAAAILAGWGLLFVRLRDHSLKPEIVIQANRLHYLRPIYGDCEACSEPLDDDAWALFMKSLERKGRGRIHVHSFLSSDGEKCCEFSGTFVALA